MLELIQLFLCFLQQLVGYILDAGASLVNLVIVALADALQAIIPLLPSLPDWPTSDSGWWSWLNWIVPVSSIVALGSTILTIFLGFFAYRIVLKWVRAL